MGYDDGGLLIDAVRKNPHAVLLLDEIEKAHPDIYNILLQVMDHATLTDNHGEGRFPPRGPHHDHQRRRGRWASRWWASGSAPCMTMPCTMPWRGIFSPEFRNRLDAVVKFNGLEHEVVLQVVGKAVREFQEELAARKVTLEVTPRCLEWLALKGYSPDFGAREISRLVSSKLKDFFVDEILFGRLANGGRAVADIENDEVAITIPDAVATTEAVTTAGVSQPRLP